MGAELIVNNKEVKSVDMADYEKLYHIAFNHLTALHDEIEQAQRDLEALYLKQSESDLPPLALVRK